MVAGWWVGCSGRWPPDLRGRRRTVSVTAPVSVSQHVPESVLPPGPLPVDVEVHVSGSCPGLRPSDEGVDVCPAVPVAALGPTHMGEPVPVPAGVGNADRAPGGATMKRLRSVDVSRETSTVGPEVDTTREVMEWLHDE